MLMRNSAASSCRNSNLFATFPLWRPPFWTPATVGICGVTLRVKYYFFPFAFRVTGWGVLPLLVGRGILCTRRRDGSELIMVIFTRMVNDGYDL